MLFMLQSRRAGRNPSFSWSWAKVRQLQQPLKRY